MNLDFPDYNTETLKSDPDVTHVYMGRMMKDLDVHLVHDLGNHGIPSITMETGDWVYVTTSADGRGFIHFMSFVQRAFHYKTECPELPGVVEIMEEL